MKLTKKDIENKEDIKLMVDTFYDKVNKDEMLSAIFNDFSGVNWEKHLPIMYNFWNTLIFGGRDYKGSPFDKHVPLPVNKDHFDKWIELFNENLDEQFEGEITNSVKTRAKTIALTFQYKLESINNPDQK